MFCPNCGKEVSEGTKFCPNCGKAIDAKDSGQKNVPSSAPMRDEFSVQKSGNGSTRLRKILWVVVGVLAILVIGVVGLILTDKRGASDTKTTQETTQVISAKASDMVEDYIRDQGTAEQKYKGKTVRISGKVMRKDQFHNSTDYYIVLEERKATGRRYTIVLDIPQDKVSLVNQLKVGENAVAEGTCDGVVKQEDPTWINVQISATKVDH